MPSHSDRRNQPWKSFCDPTSSKFSSLIATAPEQQHVSALIAQYGAENGNVHYGAENGARSKMEVVGQKVALTQYCSENKG